MFRTEKLSLTIYSKLNSGGRTEHFVYPELSPHIEYSHNNIVSFYLKLKRELLTHTKTCVVVIICLYVFVIRNKNCFQTIFINIRIEFRTRQEVVCRMHNLKY